MHLKRPLVYLSLLSPTPVSHFRGLHASAQRENTVLLAGLGIAAGAMAAKYALQALDTTAPGTGTGGGSASKEGGGEGAPSGGSQAEGGGGGTEGSSSGATGEQGKESQKSWGAEFLSKRFYRGGFEDKMTRREAALILGVRESAAPERIRDRHRKMLMCNHPDMGGSTFIAEKVRLCGGGVVGVHGLVLPRLLSLAVSFPTPAAHSTCTHPSLSFFHTQVNEAKDFLLKGGGK
jgi:DnaJ family protein C protein 19